jgi:hypothetical protein
MEVVPTVARLINVKQERHVSMMVRGLRSTDRQFGDLGRSMCGGSSRIGVVAGRGATCGG